MADVPEWLTDEFLEKALNSRGTEKYKLLSSKVTRATLPGDNFASNMHRAEIQVERNGELGFISVIIKSELTTKEMSEFLSEGNVFQRECDTYTIAIPALEKLLEQNLPEKYQPYGAKCYYTNVGPPVSLLVLEDLKQEGFRLVEKCTELDWDHCLLTVRRLATYQAASVALSKTDPSKIGPFKKSGIREKMRQAMDNVMKPMLKKLAKEAENWPECSDYLPDKLRELEPIAFDYILKAYETDENAFNALIHVDIWLNNMMFKYSEETEKVTDIRLLDMQQFCWMSPAADLVHFINCNATTEIVENQHIIVDEYYKTLKETLTELGYGHLCPSRSHLDEEMEKRCKYGVIMSFVMRSVIFPDKDKIPDLEKVFANEAEIHLSKAYLESMRKLFPIFHKKGWL